MSFKTASRPHQEWKRGVLAGEIRTRGDRQRAVRRREETRTRRSNVEPARTVDALDRNDRERWDRRAKFLGHICSHVVPDRADPLIVLAGVGTGHLGPTVFAVARRWRHLDGGVEASGLRRRHRLQRSVKRVFWLTPGHGSEPGVWYAGGTPQRCSAPTTTATRVARRWVEQPSRCGRPGCEGPEEQTPDGSMLSLGEHRPAREEPHVPRLSGGGVSSRRMAVTTGTHGTRAARWISRLMSTRSSDTIRTPCGCIRSRPDRLYQQNHCGIYRMDRPDGQWDPYRRQHAA